MVVSRISWTDARGTDAKRITSLIAQAERECPIWPGSLRSGTKPDYEELSRRFLRWHERGRTLVQVARHPRCPELLGLHLSHRQFCVLSGQEYSDMDALFINPSFRFQRNGTNLLNQLGLAFEQRATIQYDSSHLGFLSGVGYHDCQQRILSRPLRAIEQEKVGIPLSEREEYQRITLERLNLLVRPAYRTELDFVTEAASEICLRTGETASRADLRRNLLWAIEKSDPYFGKIFVIEHMGSVVGTMKLLVRYSPLDGSTIACFRHPYLKKRHRGEGICSAAQEAILAIDGPPSLAEVRYVLPDNNDPDIQHQFRLLQDSGCRVLETLSLQRQRDRLPFSASVFNT